MGFGMAKDNKFEIVAIIREELLRKTKVELKFKDASVVTQLEKVDFDYFVITNNSDIPHSSIQSFILHSDSGIIRFNARFSQSLTDKLECGLAYRIPEVILLVQRRQHQRFSFLKGYHFYCSGRYKNGENYLLQIKNISRGGCALISQKINTRFLYKNALIKGHLWILNSLVVCIAISGSSTLLLSTNLMKTISFIPVSRSPASSNSNIHATRWMSKRSLFIF